MEVRRHPGPAPEAGRRLAAVVARRGTDLRGLPGSRTSGPGAAQRRRARRRACRARSARGRGFPQIARRPRAVRQPAAAARPQNRLRQDDARAAGRLHRLRPPRMGGARHPRRAAARAPGSSRRPHRADARLGARSLRTAAASPEPDGLGRGLGRACGHSGAGAGPRPGRADAEGARGRLWGRTAQGRRPHQRLVEVEARPDERRRGADLRPARPRPPLRRVQRLHLRRLERRGGRARPRARALRQGLFGPLGCRDARDGRNHPPHHGRDLRPGAKRDADTGVRTRLRGARAEQTPPQRDRRAVPAHAPLAARQAGRRSRHAGGAQGAAAGGIGAAEAPTRDFGGLLQQTWPHFFSTSIQNRRSRA